VLRDSAGRDVIDSKETRAQEGGTHVVTKGLALAMLAVAMVVLAGCAAGPNELRGMPDDEGEVAGFWSGLWHGIIAPITFIVSLFRDNVRIYEVHNDGNWYDFGFMLGMLTVLGGGSGGAASQRAKP